MGCNSSAPADARPPRRCQRDANDPRHQQVEPRPGPPPSGASRPGVLRRRAAPATLPASPTLSLRSADDGDLFSAALEADSDAHVAQLPRVLELDDDLVVEHQAAIGGRPPTAAAGSPSPSGAPQPEPESAAVVLFGFLDQTSSSPMVASTSAAPAINRAPPYHSARSLRGSSSTDAAVLAHRSEGVLRYSPLVRINSDANFSHGHLSLTAGSTASYSARESSQPSVETSARSLRS